MTSSLLLWLAGAVLFLLGVVALLPYVPSGEWYIRLWDFPRMQLAGLTAIPLALLLAYVLLNGWNTAVLSIAAGSVVVFVWQFSHVLPYLPLTRVEVPTADNHLADGHLADGALRIAVANLDFENQQHAAVRRVLEQQEPNLLLLIEIDDAWNDALSPLRESLPYRCGVVRGEGLGIELWSDREFASAEVRHVLSDRRASVFATIDAGAGEQVHFVGVHPTPPGLEDRTGDERRDSRVRDAELVLIAKEIHEQSDEPWIITGDFNDVAWSHTTALFKRLSGLRDPRVGRRLLTTYHADYPLLRYPIDHIFVSPGFQLGMLDRFSIPGSDHFGVLASLSPPDYEPPREPVNGEDVEEAEDIVAEGVEDAAERRVLTQ